MDRVLEIVKSNFPAANLKDIDSLRVDSCEGWDSMAHFSLMISVEDAFGVRFEVEEISEIKSVNEIIKSLRSKGIKI